MTDNNTDFDPIDELTNAFRAADANDISDDVDTDPNGLEIEYQDEDTDIDSGDLSFGSDDEDDEDNTYVPAAPVTDGPHAFWQSVPYAIVEGETIMAFVTRYNGRRGFEVLNSAKYYRNGTEITIDAMGQTTIISGDVFSVFFDSKGGSL